jgi:uncharacterized protein YjiS (DUF1127 family)
MQVIQFGKPAGVAHGRRAGPWGNVLLRGILLLERWIERHRQRRALRELSDHVLKDIGISRAEAEREGRKPFWMA